MKNILIVGLGNPGKKYKNTRHNAGFWYIDQLKKKYKISLKKKIFLFGKIGKIYTLNKLIYLLKPTTFMNLSGISVQKVSKFYKIKTKNIIIVHDEINLKPGIIKEKLGNKKVGCNGVKNIIYMLKNNTNFLCIKIGIGYPKKKKIKYFVLEKPKTKEKKKILIAIKKKINKKNYII